MRMKLFHAKIVTANGKSEAPVVAPSADLATEFLRDHYHQTGERITTIAVERMDTRLKPDERLRLDDLLETAPTGFARYTPAIGWLPDHTVVTPFRLFKIEEREGAVTLVIAPNADMASAVWGASITMVEGETRLYRILDGATDLSDRQRDLLASKLEFGPAGVAVWDDVDGWTVMPPD